MVANKKCRKIRSWFHRIIEDRVGLDTPWIHEHVVNCPRCRKRLMAIGKVNIALSALKSQPHSLDLLKRANTQAVSTLKRSLRQTPKADTLRDTLPAPKFLEKLSACRHSLTNLAACLMVICLMKAGVFSSMDDFQNQGRRIVRQYYTERAGQDLADDMFVS